MLLKIAWTAQKSRFCGRGEAPGMDGQPTSQSDKQSRSMLLVPGGGHS